MVVVDLKDSAPVDDNHHTVFENNEHKYINQYSRKSFRTLITCVCFLFFLKERLFHLS